MIHYFQEGFIEYDPKFSHLPENTYGSVVKVSNTVVLMNFYSRSRREQLKIVRTLTLCQIAELLRCENPKINYVTFKGGREKYVYDFSTEMRNEIGRLPIFLFSSVEVDINANFSSIKQVTFYFQNNGDANQGISSLLPFPISIAYLETCDSQSHSSISLLYVLFLSSSSSF